MVPERRGVLRLPLRCDVDADADRTGSYKQFLNSKCFTRGWTLQELLAPKRLEFFDRDCRYIGSKQDLAAQIAEATDVSQDHLLGDFREASNAQKMCWLSRRETTLIEDRAYCMLGLFGVFLEARYGQGTNEFLRLQREIFNAQFRDGIFDESLFAWTSDLVATSGTLAPAPSCFRDSGMSSSNGASPRHASRLPTSRRRRRGARVLPSSA